MRPKVYARTMRGLIPVLLSLLLGLSMAGHGAVRPSVGVGTAVVLCTGDGAVSVMLDGNGNPLPATHSHCPACLPLVALDIDPAQSPRTPKRVAVRIIAVALPHASLPRPLHQPPATGPPAFPVV